MDNISQFPTATCLRCGFIWQKRIDKPAKCPNCQSRKWDTPRKTQKTKATNIMDELNKIRSKLRQEV